MSTRVQEDHCPVTDDWDQLVWDFVNDRETRQPSSNIKATWFEGSANWRRLDLGEILISVEVTTFPKLAGTMKPWGALTTAPSSETVAVDPPPATRMVDDVNATILPRTVNSAWPCSDTKPEVKNSNTTFRESSFQLFNNSIASSKDETLFLLTAILLGFDSARAEALRQGWDCQGAMDRLGRWIDSNQASGGRI
jgi:hypothetical protein